MDETIFDALEHAWDHATAHLHHHQPPGPYHQQQTPTEDHMSITADLNDIKDALDQAAAWKTRADQALPGILTRLEHLEANPVVQAIQAGLLTPEVEAAIAGVVKAAAALTPQPQQPTGANMAEPAGDEQPQAGQ